MKRMRIVGLCLVAVCALFAFTSSAFAVEGSLEFGKCNKTAIGAGTYSNAGCTKVAKTTETKKFEWESLSGKAVKFTSAKKAETGNAVLEAANGNQISCKGQKQTVGEYGTGQYEEKNVVGEFSGCEALGAECTSTGQSAGHINTLKLHGEVGTVTPNVKEEKSIDGADLRGQTSEFLAEFSCGPAPVIVRGGVVVKAGSIVSGKFKSATNKMLNKQTIEFVAVPKGIQEPSEWTPGGHGISNSKHEKIKEVLEGNTAGQGFERSGQSLITVQSTAGKVKVELRQCEKNIC